MRKKRLSIEDELQVNEYLDTPKEDKKPMYTAGSKGFKPRTDKQTDLMKCIEDNEITIAIGPPGTGKTYIALATALSLLKKGFQNIILVKSVTTLPGEELGFLKGSLAEKLDPYMMSFTWNIDKIAGKDASKRLMDQGILKVLPLAYIRGLTIDDSIVIIDESQNLSKHSFKTMVTRIGSNSKYIFLGDVEQIDRKKKEESCLLDILNIFKSEDFIGTIEFSDEDCVRNPNIPKILKLLRENNI